MTMAKASQQEIDNAIQLANLTDAACNPRHFEQPHFPNGEADNTPFDEDCIEDLQEFYRRVKSLSKGLMRVAFGYQVLVDNACDPDKDVLTWKQGVIIPKDTP